MTCNDFLFTFKTALVLVLLLTLVSLNNLESLATESTSINQKHTTKKLIYFLVEFFYSIPKRRVHTTVITLVSGHKKNQFMNKCRQASVHNKHLDALSFVAKISKVIQQVFAFV